MTHRYRDLVAGICRYCVEISDAFRKGCILLLARPVQCQDSPWTELIDPHPLIGIRVEHPRPRRDTATTGQDHEYVGVAPLRGRRRVLVPASVRPQPVVMGLAVAPLAGAVERAPSAGGIHLGNGLAQGLDRCRIPAGGLCLNEAA